MEANEPGFILLIVKILIAKISYPFIQAVCAAWMNAYGLYTNPGIMLSIGSNTEIGNHSTIAAHHKVIIENGVLTGPHVFIADYNHEYRDVDKPVWEQGEYALENSYIIIGEGSWLGTNVVVVGKVRIGKHCVIGANSVVTKDIPDYSVAAGIPAKVIKKYDFVKCEWVKVK